MDKTGRRNEGGRHDWLPSAFEALITVVVGLAFFAVLAYAKGLL